MSQIVKEEHKQVIKKTLSGNQMVFE